MKIVIFGAQPLASQLWHYITHDSPNEVAGFTVDSAYREADSYHGLPLVDFETVQERFPPQDHGMMIALGYTDQNRLRDRRSQEARVKGYSLNTHVGSHAMVFTDGMIGENTLIQNGAMVSPFASVGSGVMLCSGSVVSHHSTVEDYCYIAPGAILGGNSVIRSHCFVGLNATVLSGVTVAERCFVAAGALVTKDTEPGFMYVGSPARRRPLPAVFAPRS